MKNTVDLSGNVMVQIMNKNGFDNGFYDVKSLKAVLFSFFWEYKVLYSMNRILKVKSNSTFGKQPDRFLENSSNIFSKFQFSCH